MPSKSRTQKTPLVCRCAAYKFPHRKFSGDCDPQDPPPRRNIDHILDDPRRGQAEWINRQR